MTPVDKIEKLKNELIDDIHEQTGKSIDDVRVSINKIAEKTMKSSVRQYKKDLNEQYKALKKEHALALEQKDQATKRIMNAEKLASQQADTVDTLSINEATLEKEVREIAANFNVSDYVDISYNYNDVGIINGNHFELKNKEINENVERFLIGNKSTIFESAKNNGLKLKIHEKAKCENLNTILESFSKKQQEPRWI